MTDTELRDLIALLSTDPCEIHDVTLDRVVMKSLAEEVMRAREVKAGKKKSADAPAAGIPI